MTTSPDLKGSAYQVAEQTLKRPWPYGGEIRAFFADADRTVYNTMDAKSLLVSLSRLTQDRHSTCPALK